MEPQHLIRTILRRWRPIVFLAIVGAALGAASAAVAEDSGPPPVPVIYYDACHSLLVDTAIPNNVEQWDVRNLAQLAQRLTQGEIPAEVAAATGATNVEVASQVRAAVRNDIQSLSVCSVAATPAEAEALADGFAARLLSFLGDEARGFHEERLTRAAEQVAKARTCLDAAEAEIAAVLEVNPLGDVRSLEEDAAACQRELINARNTERGFEVAGVPVVPLETLEGASAAEISESTYDRRVRAGAAGANIEIGAGDAIGSAGRGVSSSSSGPVVPDGPSARAGIGAMLGTALGLGYVIFAERLDSRLRRKEDVEASLDLPVLAEIPALGRRDRRITRLVSLDEPRSRTAESFRALRSALDYARRVDEEQGRAVPGAHVVLVTSAGPSEGKTTTIANLATVMSEGDRSVLAINCDFRRPRLHRYLGGTARPRSLNVTDVPGVQLVTQVTDNDAESTPSDVVVAQRRLIERARDCFDVILLDTAPILTTNDAAELLGVADHVVLVVSAAQTKAEAADRAAELLERRGRAPLGVALVGVSEIHDASDYYYDDRDPYLEQGSRRSRRERSGVDDLVDAGVLEASRVP